MDRELDQSFQRRRMGRRLAWGAASLGLFVAVLVLLPGWLRPSVERDRIRTGIVDRGPIEGIVEASGTVIPAFEGVLSSPVDARVEKILKRPGETVRAGEEILRLDTSQYRLALETLEDNLAKKANEQEQIRLALDKSLRDLRGRIESARLDAEAFEYRAEQNRKLQKDGLVSEQTLKASETDAKKARIELSKLQDSVEDERQAAQARVQGLNLDLQTLYKERANALRRLELATTRSDRAGVLTWVIPQEGATIRTGEVIARIADLDSFRVEATVSDVHSSRLAAGLPVRVMIDGQPLSGRLSTVYPTIENGAVKFAADLDDPRHPKLRNNLRADVLVVTASRAGALRVPKGPFTQGGNAEPVFVIDGDRAVRRSVRFGVAGYEHFEVLDGLSEGEEVILSDMSDHAHLQQVSLK
ncbi:MAG TPA: HlyD family efflux transporter periplasmic adaptor subunit [Thermoanaerobaculia bacterium]|nr:HlyD family efflux transporter periplasmic adaptor subunit [Thermoanaerobaculia bacterium]